MKQIKITKDEAFVIADALDEYSPSIIDKCNTKEEAIAIVNTIEMLQKNIKNYSYDTRRTGRRSVVSLIGALTRLHIKYFGL